MLRSRTFTWIGALLALLLGATVTFADKLVLKDGRTLNGQVVSEDADSVTFATRVDGRPVVERFNRNLIRKVVNELPGTSDPFREESAEAEASAAPEATAVRSRRVIFLVDVSSSMALGGRLEKAREQANALIDDYDADTRLQIYAFDERVRPVQRSFRNVLETNQEVFRNAVSRLTISPIGRSDILSAFKQALRAEPDVIHLFTDGVHREAPGTSPASIQEQLVGLLTGKAQVHVHLIQDGLLGALGGEPLADARRLGAAITEATGGELKASPAELAVRPEEVGARIEVLAGDEPVDALVVGRRYKLRLVVTGLEDETRISEYLTSLPILARSVTGAGSDVVRRQDVPLIGRDGGVESVYELKLVEPTNRYANAEGYLAAEAGGYVAFFFDALGRWITLKLPVRE